MPGMRMSISTTSGRCSATAAATSVPSAASPTIAMSSAPAEQHRQPGAHERVVVDDQDADLLVIAATAARRGARSRRSRRGRASSVPPDSVARSASPTSPVPEPGIGVPAAVRTGTGLRTSIVRPVARCSLDEQLDGRRRGVLVRVRERLLDDAQRVSSDRVGHGRQIGDADVGIEVHAGGARLLQQRGQRHERRLRRLRRFADRAVAQQADHRAQVLERLVGAGPDHRRGARHLLGRRVGPELERAGVQAQRARSGGRGRRASRVRCACARRSAPAPRAAAARRACAAPAHAARGDGRGRECPARRRRRCTASRRSSARGASRPACARPSSRAATPTGRRRRSAPAASGGTRRR